MRATKRPDQDSNQQPQKALRVGIIQNGKLVEERWFRKATAITVGGAANNTFHVDNKTLPKRFPLFTVTKEGMSLQVAEGMRGKLVMEGRHLPLLQIDSFGEEVGRFTTRVQRSAPGVQRAVYAVPVNENVRGRVELGTTTLLFQYATPPPAPTLSALPKALAGSWHKGMDWAYASIIMFSFLAHSAGVYWLQQLGPLPANAAYSVTNLTQRLQQPLLIVPKAPAPKAPQAKPDSKGETKTAPPKKRPAKTTRTRPSKPTKTPRAQGSAGTINPDQIGILKILGSKGKNGSVNNLMAKDGSDLMVKRLKQITGVRSSAKDGFRSRRKPSTPGGKLRLCVNCLDKQPASGKVLRVAQRRNAADVAAAASKLKFTFDKPEEIDGTLDTKAVMRVIKRNYASIKYCYERIIKRDPTLRGKIAVEVKINSMGRSYGSSVVRDQIKSRPLTRCLLRRIKSLRFPRPKDGDVTLVLPFVFTQAQ